MLSRNELIGICQEASLPQNLWSDRDTARAQMQVGMLRALLQAECDFYTDGREDGDRTFRVEMVFRGFDWFEGSLDPYRDRDELMSTETFYLPTRKRLDAVQGRDWCC